MRTKTSLSIGIGLLAIIVSLSSTQGQSVADINESATRIATESVVMLSEKHEHEEEKHEHNHGNIDEETQAAAAESALRAAARSVGNGKSAVAPRQRFLAALDKPDIEVRHKNIAQEVLMALPSPCRNTLQKFYVRYEKPEHRGLAGKSVMILDGTVEDSEFRSLFVHESGHNWDLGCLTGTSESGKSAFSDGEEVVYKNDPSVAFYEISWITSKVQRSTSRPEDFVSGYASYNIFEDFAESFAYFVLQNDQFAKRAETNTALEKKYNWIRDTYFNGEIPQIATGKSTVRTKAPWDITKLAYVWHPYNTVAKK